MLSSGEYEPRTARNEPIPGGILSEYSPHTGAVPDRPPVHSWTLLAELKIRGAKIP